MDRVRGRRRRRLIPPPSGRSANSTRAGQPSRTRRVASGTGVPRTTGRSGRPGPAIGGCTASPSAPTAATRTLTASGSKYGYRSAGRPTTPALSGTIVKRKRFSPAIRPPGRASRSSAGSG